MDIESDSKIGRYLTLGELCTCTNTYRRFASAIQPLPASPDSLQALQDLAEYLLDPLIDHFGRQGFELTYGFCSADLRRHLVSKDPETGNRFGRVDPSVDQHMSHERSARTGKPFCKNPGAACDFRFLGLDSRLIVDRIVDGCLPFDSLYYYGSDRPIHLSHGPMNRRAMWAFNPAGVPTRKGLEVWLPRLRDNQRTPSPQDS